MCCNLHDNGSHQARVPSQRLHEKEDVHHFCRLCIDKLIRIDENGGEVDDWFCEDPVKL